VLGSFFLLTGSLAQTVLIVKPFGSLPVCYIMVPMRQIPLTRGYFALIDDEDFDELSRYKWSYCNGYAVRGERHNGKYVAIPMHGQLMHPTRPLVVDHINRHSLDNRRANLRLATRSQNAVNAKLSRANSSGVKGVSYHKSNKLWRAYISVDGRIVQLGMSKSFEKAVQLRLEAQQNVYGGIA
jgi:hypothetical protein